VNFSGDFQTRSSRLRRETARAREKADPACLIRVPSRDSRFLIRQKAIFLSAIFLSHPLRPKRGHRSIRQSLFTPQAASDEEILSRRRNSDDRLQICPTFASDRLQICPTAPPGLSRVSSPGRNTSLDRQNIFRRNPLPIHTLRQSKKNFLAIRPLK
jgi:hypothetical protein